MACRRGRDGGSVARARGLLAAVVLAASACAPLLAPPQRRPPTIRGPREIRALLWPGMPGLRRARKAAAAALRSGDFEAARSALGRAARGPDAAAALVELGHLELRHGLVGTAALHLARAASLDPDRLRGDRAACGVFLRRAAVAAEAGAYAWAYRDVARADRACPGGDAARVELRRRILAGLARERTPSDEGTEVASAVRREVAAASPQALVAALVAEASGARGPTLIPDEDLRGILAGRPFREVERAAEQRGPGWPAYVRLRLRRVAEVPRHRMKNLHESAEAREFARHLSDVQIDLGRLAQAHAEGRVPAGALVRAWVVAGDVETAMASLADARVGAGATGGEGASEADDAAWPLRFLRFRIGLEGARPARFLAEGADLARRAAATPRGRALIADTIRSLLARGRIYPAMALLSPEVAPLLDDEVHAVARATTVLEAWCGQRPCRRWPSRHEVEEAVGAEALARSEGIVRLRGPGAKVGCVPPPVPAPLSARGGLARRWQYRIEADPLLACGLARAPGEVRRDVVVARTLLDLWSLGGDLPDGAWIEAAPLAFAVGDRMRGRRLLRTGLDVDPGAWRRALDVALDVGDDVAVARILRDRHAQAGNLPLDLHRTWVLRTLRRAASFEGRTPAGTVALARAVEDYVRAAPEGHRWMARHLLVDAVLARGAGFDRETLATLAPLLIPADRAPRFSDDVRRLARAGRGEDAAHPPPGPAEAALWPVDALVPLGRAEFDAAVADGRVTRAVELAAGLLSVADDPATVAYLAGRLEALAAKVPGALPRVRAVVAVVTARSQRRTP
ncbi:MAG: hypothetical protein D6705_11110 [Deltaproteobacteria bacterium]|nr:MAG: hypothetical protein D6705_11110 [Deltaproteobacteria bacterium]